MITNSRPSLDTGSPLLSMPSLLSHPSVSAAPSRLSPAVRQVGFCSAPFTGLLAHGWPVAIIIQTALLHPDGWKAIRSFAVPVGSIILAGVFRYAI
ncbi:MAG: hypothetical protein JSV61_12985 [Anaerolineales bacterium]|nr:MAG: hypothetical protein JSV61_12985 [Anaerolineales bacterium]